MAKIKVSLSSNSIKDAIKKLNKAKKELAKVDDELAKELAEQTKDKIVSYYSKKGFSSSDTPTIGVVKYSKGYKAFIRGRNVIYEEFGTGDIGAKNGHPWKGDYGLNPYNSGATIRSTNNLSPEFQEEQGLQDGLYWTYTENGEKVFTQGIPAGKFMYNADIWLRDNYKRIAKKKVDDVLSKL